MLLAYLVVQPAWANQRDFRLQGSVNCIYKLDDSGDTDTDLTSTFRYGVSSYAVDAEHRQYQCHNSKAHKDRQIEAV